MSQLGLSFNNNPIGSFPTLNEAREAAKKNPGSEAIVKKDVNTFDVYALNKEDTKVVNEGKYSKLGTAMPVFEFSVEKSKVLNVSLDRVFTEKFDTKEEAIDKAKALPGSEKIARNDDNTFSMNPVDQESIAKAKARDFSKESPRIQNFVVEDPTGTSEILDTLSKTGQAKLNVINEVLGNIEAGTNKTKYVHKEGLYQTDCSGFLRAVADKVGDNSINDLNAEGISNYIKAGKNGIVRVTSPADLKAGDMIVFKTPNAETSGHAMMATDKEPEPITDPTGKTIAYNVTIVDSTSAQHGPDDTARKGNKSGVGKGIITIGVDAKGTANAIWWGPDKTNNKYTSGVMIGRIAN